MKSYFKDNIFPVTAALSLYLAVYELFPYRPKPLLICVSNRCNVYFVIYIRQTNENDGHIRLAFKTAAVYNPQLMVCHLSKSFLIKKQFKPHLLNCRFILRFSNNLMLPSDSMGIIWSSRARPCLIAIRTWTSLMNAFLIIYFKVSIFFWPIFFFDECLIYLVKN